MARPDGGRIMLGAGVHIVAPDGRLLMIEQERFGVIEWEGVGGALEPGESIEDCARREALEEAGLTVRLERLIRVSEFWDENAMTGVGFLFLGSPDPWPQEVALPAVDGLTRFRAYRWCTRDEVARLARWRYDVTHDAWPADITAPLMHRIDAKGTLRIRRGRREEAGDLTALAIRSKSHWGYSAEFMALVRPEMTLSGDEVADDETWTLEDGAGRLIGFYRIVPTEPAVLEDLWVEPQAMGAGHGRLLLEHAVATARALGVTALELDADPNAVGFYERMGARQVGDTPSAIVPGRRLPRMRIDLG